MKKAKQSREKSQEKAKLNFAEKHQFSGDFVAKKYNLDKKVVKLCNIIHIVAKILQILKIFGKFWQILKIFGTKPGMGARRNFCRGGKTAWTDRNDIFFGAPKAQTKIFAIFSPF